MDTERRVTATEAKNRFGQIIRLARRTGQPVFVESRGKPVVVIVSVETFERYRQKNREISGGPGERARRSFGMWAERADLDELMKQYPEAFKRPYHPGAGLLWERVLHKDKKNS